ncbi:MAG: ATP-binding cassette domain-containing protein [Clostridiales bacterium]|nr:ATP-binding cassette domain-containing protein [Clostridiales bacterium]
MLQLKGITKHYQAGDTVVKALKGIDLTFRESEFVAVLGPSGCGKTTLLNIVGGLDRYTSGDLIINGVSTRQYKDGDWDAYRNHTIGFVFQSYNLIGHQTVLGNVELALTLSGVSRTERRRRAEAALREVGLGDQLHKKPNQMSGGQMQRVAIARALVNDPDIILADEPTGALDTETSVQIMEILRRIGKSKLIIMVTHNPQLAESYATRTINLLDGEVVGDTDPYCAQGEQKREPVKQKRPSMSFATALSLSLKNLATKKARTFLTSFAGSIGIIGIALVLALSNGFQTYISKMQSDTLSAYPLTIYEQTMDMTAMMSMMQDRNDLEKYPEGDMVYVSEIYSVMANQQITNKITQQYLKDAIETIDPALYNAVSYQKDVALNVYRQTEYNGQTVYAPVQTAQLWSQMVDNEEFLLSQYDILGEGGRLPQNKNEIVLVLDSYNRLMDVTLMSLGIYHNQKSLSFDELMGLSFRLILNDGLYRFDGQKWNTAMVDGDTFEAGVELKVVGLLRPKPETSGASVSGAVGYTAELVDFIAQDALSSQIVLWQQEHEQTDAFTGTVFMETSGQTAQEQYQENLKRLSASELPSTIAIYPVDFKAKNAIKEHLDAYNNAQNAEADKVFYTDMMELMVESVNTVIDTISYVLIAFTAISLVVSSIMIGIITYISVLERTKEIGVLRSIGASKRDISRVFNAETLIIGFVAGAIGVGITLLLSIPINLIVGSLVEISSIASLAPLHAVILVAISMLLTLIAGTIPSRIAARKDPVAALRSE